MNLLGIVIYGKVLKLELPLPYVTASKQTSRFTHVNLSLNAIPFYLLLFLFV